MSASADLRRIGAPASAARQRASQSRNPEVRERAKVILNTLKSAAPNSLGMTFVRLEPGLFTMGPEQAREERVRRIGGPLESFQLEQPAHPVRLTLIRVARRQPQAERLGLLRHDRQRLGMVF